MRYRTRRLLTAATLTLLAVACAGALGAAKAQAASQHSTTKVTKISACGFVAHKAGTYELTQSVADSGSGACITITANNVTLYLDSHTITGTGSDTCLVVDGVSGMSVKDTVVGGKMPKPGAKTKSMKPATLTNCHTGLAVTLTSGATASYLNMVAPTSTGVFEESATGANLSHITVPMHLGNSGAGFVLEGGADNSVTNSTVNYDGSNDAFIAVEETGDTFMHDTVNDPYSSGSAGTGFFEAASSRDTWSHCTTSGQFNGFNFDSEGSGPVTATYDKATGSPANSHSVGFMITGAFQQADSASSFHTLLSHNKTIGFQTGFDDENGGIPSTPVAETWTDNTADNYGAVGFLINHPTDYTMTGNIADANTSGKKYKGGSTYGFALVSAAPTFPFARFANNQAYDSGYGFYSAALPVGGKGNIAKRNAINSVGVEITG